MPKQSKWLINYFCLPEVLNVADLLHFEMKDLDSNCFPSLLNRDKKGLYLI